MGRPKYEKFNYVSAYPIPIGPAQNKLGCMVEAYRIDDPRIFEFVLVRGQNVISRTTNINLVIDSWRVNVPTDMQKMVTDSLQREREKVFLLEQQKKERDARRQKVKNSWKVGDLVAFRRDERLRMRVVRREESKNSRNPFIYEYWGIPLTKGGQIRTNIEPVKISPVNWRSMRARGVYKLFKEP